MQYDQPRTDLAEVHDDILRRLHRVLGDRIDGQELDDLADDLMDDVLGPPRGFEVPDDASGAS